MDEVDITSLYSLDIEGLSVLSKSFSYCFYIGYGPVTPYEATTNERYNLHIFLEFFQGETNEGSV